MSGYSSTHQRMTFLGTPGADFNAEMVTASGLVTIRPRRVLKPQMLAGTHLHGHHDPALHRPRSPSVSLSIHEPVIGVSRCTRLSSRRTRARVVSRQGRRRSVLLNRTIFPGSSRPRYSVLILAASINTYIRIDQTRAGSAQRLA